MTIHNFTTSQLKHSLLPSKVSSKHPSCYIHHFLFLFKPSKCVSRCKRVNNEARCVRKLKDHSHLLLSITFLHLNFPSLELVVVKCLELARGRSRCGIRTVMFRA
ncbi:hypothetical protein HanIR_Chr13g0667891 [Helianthus annuus]|nr:hypothetical protein HanIR_Chr13g0667891 [Helianthus annuus]